MTDAKVDDVRDGFARAANLVVGIKKNDPKALEDFYRVINTGIRYRLCNRLGPQDLDDRVHDIFLMLVTQIQDDKLREPARLMGYVKTLTHMQIIHEIKKQITARQNKPLDARRMKAPTASAEKEVIRSEQMELVKEAIARLPPKKREVLTRFYVNNEPADKIRQEMDLTETQFRLLKSRTLKELGEQVKQVNRPLQLRQPRTSMRTRQINSPAPA